jgi:hypothetical protein
MNDYRRRRSLLLIVGAIAAFCAAEAVAAEVGRAAGSGAQTLFQDNNTVAIFRDGQAVAKYRFTDVPFKPYVKELFTPGGVQVLRDSPLDHKHHHALMFAVAVDNVDFWSETPICGRQVSRGIEAARSTAENDRRSTSFAHKIDWLAPDEKLLLRERRTLVVHGGKEIGATLLTWQSRLETPPTKDAVKLTGSHYFGLGTRFVESMDKAGRFFNSEGKEGPVVRGNERLTPAKWCAYASKADGKPVTVALFDHPKNLRHPARFFTMRPFAYLGATFNLWKEPLVLKAGQPLDLRYGVALWDGEVEATEVDRLYQQWIELSGQ